MIGKLRILKMLMFRKERILSNALSVIVERMSSIQLIKDSLLNDIEYVLIRDVDIDLLQLREQNQIGITKEYV